MFFKLLSFTYFAAFFVAGPGFAQERLVCQRSIQGDPLPSVKSTHSSALTKEFLKQQYQVLKTLDRVNINSLQSQQNQIIGLELLVAAGTSSRLESRWGHLLLRFVNPQIPWEQNLVLGFVANARNFKPSKIKALTGHYRIFPMVLTLRDFWKQYARGESRPLDRYIISTTPEIRSQLIQNLATQFETIESKGFTQGFGRYWFFGNNCARILQHFLQKAGLNQEGHFSQRPLKVAGHFRNSGLIVFPKLEIPTLNSARDHAAQVLKLDTCQMEMGERWPADASDQLIASLSPLELRRLLHEIIMMPLDVRDRIRHYLATVQTSSSSYTKDQLIGFKQVPGPLYGLCDSTQCADVLLNMAKEIWTNQELEQNSKALRKSYRRVFGSGFPISSLASQPELLRHFEILSIAQFDPRN